MTDEKAWWQAPQQSDWFPAKGEEDVVGRFEVRPWLHVAKSKAAGEHIYVPRVGIFMRAKSSADVSWQQLAPHNAKQLIQRFPEAWEMFQKSRQDKPQGRPLSEIGANQDMQFRMVGIGVETVEQLAESDDKRVNDIFGGAKLQEKALALVIGDEDDETPDAPKRRGRPPKIQEAAEFA